MPSSAHLTLNHIKVSKPVAKLTTGCLSRWVPCTLIKTECFELNQENWWWYAKLRSFAWTWHLILQKWNHRTSENWPQLGRCWWWRWWWSFWWRWRRWPVCPIKKMFVGVFKKSLTSIIIIITPQQTFLNSDGHWWNHLCCPQYSSRHLLKKREHQIEQTSLPGLRVLQYARGKIETNFRFILLAKYFFLLYFCTKKE